jgi:predicted metal-dependent hydrolase
MQEVLAELTMAERAQVGRALLKTAKLENQMKGFVYQATHFPSHDRVFVLCSSKHLPRPEVLERVVLLLRGAMAFYKTKNCLVIVDRDGEGFEIAKSKMDYRCTSADEALGNHYFAHLRTTSLVLEAV